MNHAVVGIIFDESREKVLVVKRRDVSIWVLPGGVVDEGETIEEAVIREIKEETGLDVSITRKVGEYTPLQIISTITHVFECTRNGGELTTTSETRDLGFKPIQSLPKLFFILHEIWIHEAIKQYPYVIKRYLTELTWWSSFKYFLKHPIHMIRFAMSKVLGMPFNSR